MRSKGRVLPSLRQGQGDFIIDYREVPPTPACLERLYTGLEPQGALLANDANTLCELVDLARREEKKKLGLLEPSPLRND
jgi:hypothetical protein